MTYRLVGREASGAFEQFTLLDRGSLIELDDAGFGRESRTAFGDRERTSAFVNRIFHLRNLTENCRRLTDPPRNRNSLEIEINLLGHTLAVEVKTFAHAPAVE